MTEAVDVVVVGAGAAVLAAAWTVRRHGLSVLVLEVRGRIGGRAWTIRLLGGHPADLGCGWLHCADRNPWTTHDRSSARLHPQPSAAGLWPSVRSAPALAGGGSVLGGGLPPVLASD